MLVIRFSPWERERVTVTLNGIGGGKRRAAAGLLSGTAVGGWSWARTGTVPAIAVIRTTVANRVVIVNSFYCRSRAAPGAWATLSTSGTVISGMSSGATVNSTVSCGCAGGSIFAVSLP